MAKAERTEVVITDPQAIRAMAHRTRLDVIDELFGSADSYTATELANRFGGTPSAMSYHLRALEKWGYLKRSSESEDGRERRWRAAADSLNVGGNYDEAGSSAVLRKTLPDLHIGQLRDRIVAAMETVAGNPVSERPVTLISTTKLKLSRVQQDEFTTEFHDLVERYRVISEGSDEQMMYLHTVLIPDVL